MISLQRIAQKYSCIILLFIPPIGILPPSILYRIYKYSNTIISIQDFVHFNKKPEYQQFMEYDGIVNFHKLPRFHTFQVSFSLPESLNYLFRLRQNGMCNGILL